MTRHSQHDLSASVSSATGVAVLSPTDVRVQLSEARFPFGQADVTVPIGQLDFSNPRAGDARLLLDLRESVGDPVRVSEITADHGGSMAALTAVFGGAVAPVTATYFEPWNDDETITGSAARLNLVLHGREVDHAAGVVRLTGYTDEALAVVYRLVSTSVETSGSLSVRGTVNFALSKIGAALLPGPVDAVIEEPDAIVWEPGVSAWEYIRNVAEAAGLVVRCDGRRRWTLTRRDDTRPERVVLDRSTGIRERIDVDGEQYADAVVVRYDWTDPASGESRTRVDTASQRADAVTVKLVERRVPYPGRGAAAYWLKRLAARGRMFDITQVNDYAIRPGMEFTAPVPATPTQVGRIEQIEWTLPAASMTITTAGAADAVDGAIDLYPDGIFINDLVGTINDQHPGSEVAA